MQVAALEVAGMIEIKEGQKCWKGYEKKGTKMMFGKRYNNCVKKKTTKEELELPKISDKKPVSKGLSQGIRDPKTNEVKKGDTKGSETFVKPVKLKDSYAPVTEGVMTLMGKKKKQEEKKKI